MPWIEVTPVIEPRARNWCTKPYPNHPKGCPNFNHKKGCPPAAPSFDEVYDLHRSVFAIFNIFDMAAHLQKMRAAHPTWTDRQLRCCLYWQGRARKQLRREIALFARGQMPKGYGIADCPEAMGVNIHATMAKAGIYLEWPPEKVAYQIALAAKLKGEGK